MTPVHAATDADRKEDLALGRHATALAVEHMLGEFTVEARDGRVHVEASPEMFARVAAQLLALYESQVAMEAPGDEELREALSDRCEPSAELQTLAIIAPVLFVLGHSAVELPGALVTLIERAASERLVAHA